jgi:hypothetical protein
MLTMRAEDMGEDLTADVFIRILNALAGIKRAGTSSANSYRSALAWHQRRNSLEEWAETDRVKLVCKAMRYDGERMLGGRPRTVGVSRRHAPAAFRCLGPGWLATEPESRPQPRRRIVQVVGIAAAAAGAEEQRVRIKVVVDAVVAVRAATAGAGLLRGDGRLEVPRGLVERGLDVRQLRLEFRDLSVTLLDFLGQLVGLGLEGGLLRLEVAQLPVEGCDEPSLPAFVFLEFADARLEPFLALVHRGELGSEAHFS